MRTACTQMYEMCLQATVRWQDAEELASAAAADAEAGQGPAPEAGAPGARQAPATEPGPAEQQGVGQSHARPAAEPADAPPATGAVQAPGLGTGMPALPAWGRPSALGGAGPAPAAPATPDWHSLPESERALSVPVPAEISQLTTALQQEARSNRSDPGASWTPGAASVAHADDSVFSLNHIAVASKSELRTMGYIPASRSVTVALRQRPSGHEILTTCLVAPAFCTFERR